MPVIRVQVAFHHDSGLPEDQVVNTFHFQGTANDVLGAQMVSDLVSFYGAANTTAALLTRYSGALAGTATFKCYNLDEPLPRTPFYQETRNPLWTPSTSTPAPPETAVCLSYSAAAASGLNPRRRRGRIYLGPLIWTTSVYEISGSVVRVAPAFRTDIGVAAARLKSLSQTAGHNQWVVFSRTGASYATVQNGWVDNAFDTQRRRGEAPSVRNTWS